MHDLFNVIVIILCCRDILPSYEFASENKISYLPTHSNDYEPRDSKLIVFKDGLDLRPPNIETTDQPLYSQHISVQTAL
jgi:hypothetical protein